MEYAIAKMSTKGQIVIPNKLRDGIKSGDQFLIIKDGSKMILKNLNELSEDLKDEIAFAQRVEKAWVEYENGNFHSKSKDEFLKELETW